MLKIVIIGQGPLGAGLIKGCLYSSNLSQIVGVLPWPFGNKQDNFTLLTKKWNLPLLKSKSINSFQFTQELLTVSPDIVLIGSWGEIIKPYVFNLQGPLFINCHPSLLPYHRGPNPYTTTLLSDDIETGVTLHLIDKNIDTGPILLQKKFKITPYETGESLRERCANLAEKMIPLLLNQIKNNSYKLTPQPFKTSYERISPTIGWINWQDDPQKILRKIRAIYPWYDILTRTNSITIGFKKGELINCPTSDLYQNSDKPGLIRRKTQEGIYVTTLDAKQLLHLQKPQVCNWPAWKTKLFFFSYTQAWKNL